MATLPESATPPTPDRRRKLADRIRELGLSHFRPHEFFVGMGAVRNGVRNGFPPRRLWDNVIPTAMVADIARQRVGCPIEITSAYRHEGYNEVVGGADQSQHLAFRALDLVPRNGKVQRLFDILEDMHGDEVQLPVQIAPAEGPAPANYGKQGLSIEPGGFRFKGGLGLYLNEGFVHIDTRGRKARWGV